jgi:hypothetical protein
MMTSFRQLFIYAEQEPGKKTILEVNMRDGLLKGDKELLTRFAAFFQTYLHRSKRIRKSTAFYPRIEDNLELWIRVVTMAETTPDFTLIQKLRSLADLPHTNSAEERKAVILELAQGKLLL